MSSVSQDMEQRRRVEEALREQEERLRVALNAARTGTWIWNLRTRKGTIDESLRRLLGLAPGRQFETIEEFYEIVHPEDRADFAAAFERTLREHVHLDTQFRVTWPDGSEHWLLDQGDIAFGDERQPLYLTGACVDITERKQAERSLREHEARFREYAANVRDYALLQLDAQGRIVSWNAGAERVLGYNEGEILGKPAQILFTPEDIEKGEYEYEMDNARRTGRSIDERWHLRKDGTRFWASGVLTSMFDDRGRVHGFAKVMRDETERRRAEEQTRASLREKEVLLQEIHHRVKNNLQVIASLLRLQSEHTPDESARGMFAEAQNRVQAISGIHEQLYRSPDLASIEFGAYLSRVVRDLFSFYAVPDDQVHLTVDVKNAELVIDQAIPCGLIVNELVTNALKHAFPKGRRGTVRVSLDCTGGECVLIVEDNGVGLPGGFDWEHAESLGLQLVQVLTVQLFGRVEVDRAAGTRFKIYFTPSKT